MSDEACNTCGGGPCEYPATPRAAKDHRTGDPLTDDQADALIDEANAMGKSTGEASIDELRAELHRKDVEYLLDTERRRGFNAALRFVLDILTTDEALTGRTVSARRIVWEHEHGPLPGRKQFVSLSCGNSSCMSHLVLREHDPKKRFWAYVDKSAGPNGCWIWTGGVQKGGYGGFRINPRKTMRAHRFAWEITHGPIPAVNEDGVEVVACHRCDTPLCVNPAHLFLGTDADNAADKVAKGRQAKGETMRKAYLRGLARKKERAA